MVETGIERERPSKETRDKLTKTIKEIREAKLVGCVREVMVMGFVVCPLIELCPHAPKKKDIGDALRNGTSGRLGYYDDNDPDMDKKILESIDDIMKILEEAKQITAKCPLGKLIKGEYPNPRKLDP